MAPSQRIGLLDILRVAEQELAPGTVLMKRYSIIKTLGAGRFGMVYLAHDAELKIDIALKVLNSLVAQDKALMRELRRQSGDLMRLQHAHIARLYGVGEDADRKFLTMEYAGGSPVEEVRGRYPGGKLPLEPALDYVGQIGEGLEYAHTRKILHLDLQIKNILLDGQGLVKISGFGLEKAARALMTRLSSAEMPLGIAHLAPEQLLERGVDVRSDIYALGAILYEMVSGRPPFYTGNIRQAIMSERPAELDVPESINAILQKALAKDKDLRWKSVAEMCRALDESGVKGGQRRWESKRVTRHRDAAVPPSEDRANADGKDERAAATKSEKSSLLDQYRHWMQEKDHLDGPDAPPGSVYHELWRAEYEQSRLRFLDEAYSNEQERKEREVILRIEAEQFAQRLKKQEEKYSAESSSLTRLWGISVTLLMGTLLALFVYKLNQEQLGKAPARTEESAAVRRGGTSSQPPAQPRPASLKTKESVLTAIEHKTAEVVQDVQVSPDTARVAYKARLASQWFIMLDGQKGPVFDAIDQIIFSADRDKMAYRAARAGRYTAVLNHKSGPLFEGVDALRFSPDGSTLAYIANEARKFFVMQNNKREPEYEWVGHLVYSPDSHRVAYAAKKAERVFVVVGHEKGEEFAGIHDLVFSPDNQQLAYVAREGDQEILVVGNERVGSFSKIAKPIFSPDSKTLAYMARHQGREFVVVGKERGQAYDSIIDLAFASDGRTVTYVAREGGKSFLVRGDKQGPPFDTITGLVTSPDNQMVAYVARQSGKEVIIWEGQQGPAFDQITGLIFSADSRQLAYIAKERGKEFIVVGNKRGPLLDEVWQPVFTPDARKIVYGARVGNSVLRVEMSTL